MDLKLLEIQPRELRFEFELLKKSSCLVHLMNNTDHLVAFKVKTTSPRRYSVEPSIGAIEPKSISNLTVIMHAPIVLPLNMQSRDKFLIQSIALPVGTTDIDPDMFNKDSGRQMEEVKLRVVFISPLPSPVLISNGGGQKQEVTHQLGKDFEQLKSTKNAQNVGYGKDVERLKSNKEIEELNLRNAELQHKLREKEVTIIRLRGDKSTALADIQKLKQKLALFKRENSLAEANIGFPFPFVCLVALIGLALGYYLFHSNDRYLL